MTPAWRPASWSRWRSCSSPACSSAWARGHRPAAAPIVRVGGAGAARRRGHERVRGERRGHGLADGAAGWTVELGALAKDGAERAQSLPRRGGREQGRADVGVLDSDSYGSLPGGSYVVYSGQVRLEGRGDRRARRS